MEQPIIGFDQDELGDWRAILACGHRRHVRHNPPLVERPWVLTEEGRNRFLGVRLECKACDEGEPVGDGMILSATLEAAYARFREDLYRFIRQHAPNSETAEHILLDTFLAIHDGLGDLREDDRLDEWIYHATCNAIGDYYRRKAQAGPAARFILREEGDSSAGPALVGSMLDCLPGKYRQAVILTERLGLEPREIAGRLDIPLPEAEARVRLGQQMLREAVLDCCHFEFDRHDRMLRYQPYCATCIAREPLQPPESTGGK